MHFVTAYTPIQRIRRLEHSPAAEESISTTHDSRVGKLRIICETDGRWQHFKISIVVLMIARQRIMKESTAVTEIYIEERSDEACGAGK